MADGIDADGSFLDIGCANGHLAESVPRWCGERGLVVEPHGVDLAPGLVALARERLPQWRRVGGAPSHDATRPNAGTAWIVA